MKQKQYVWLNPVVLNQYEEEALYPAVNGCGYEIVTCRENHMEQVRQKYLEVMRNSLDCVMDMRCPAAADYVKSHYPEAEVTFPDIEPILIHCARELAGRCRDGERLTVTTPCRELKEMGNRIGLPHTRFMTWKEFKEENRLELKERQLAASPIPPGFFASCAGAARPLSSRRKIDEFFTNRQYRDKKVAEMLYCTEGCHHGNGV